MIIQGDCLEKLKELPENSVDSIVTDPPAGISFMGKDWDKDKGGRDNWIKWMCEVATECKRVLKPGGHAFVWALPRTSHWTGMAWENAGFQPRDIVHHCFGSGFPKSLNIGKAIDKLQGNEREKISRNPNSRENCDKSNTLYESGTVGKTDIITKGNSPWEGYGTALKPAVEDWWLMRKPLEKGLSVAENCLKWGTGGINIDESRVEIDQNDHIMKYPYTEGKYKSKYKEGTSYKFSNQVSANKLGRFPANLIHDNSQEVRECFPETGKSTGGRIGNKGSALNMMGQEYEAGDPGYGDSGNASRFFKSIIYTAKASKSERNMGCEGLEEKTTDDGREVISDRPHQRGATLRQNHHPTVKPIALMEYLIKMITPKGGTVLDPFAGSGSTGVAAKKNGYNFIGIEKEPEYCKIAEARIKAVKVENKLL